ncbi:MAG: tyrosine-type recombinase/integrase [Pseudotabrizicola sp.]|uniref:tyrosine-type recombinase/integrase n=1 Tax=Pseudotabrizicola sp. TaxID=2939647 RepID=UPI002715CC12|nr:tyrosine-type recombinase/integrase [Pseudotabrizicola sp.]MDO9641353.1 tyrosine-type recombinase/integrase [Pseudotabrizicola sp.]
MNAISRPENFANATAFNNVTSYHDRHNKLRWRHRKGGRTTSLGTEYGSAEFIRRYAVATNSAPLHPSDIAARVPSRFQQGTLSRLIDEWYKSAHFEALGKGTRKGYRCQAERLRGSYGDYLVQAMQPKQIRDMMAAKAGMPNAANNVLRILRFILDVALEKGLIGHYVARDVKKYATPDEGFHTWTEKEISAFYAVHHPGTVPHTCMTIMLYTGAARKDAASMGRANLCDGRICYSKNATKTCAGVEVNIPIHSALAACLALVPPEFKFFIQTAKGTELTPGTLGNYMRKWCNEAGLPQCSSHGLRKACERRLGEAGMKEQEIASVLGFVDTTTPHIRLGMSVRSELADRAISILP